MTIGVEAFSLDSFPIVSPKSVKRQNVESMRMTSASFVLPDAWIM